MNPPDTGKAPPRLTPRRRRKAGLALGAAGFLVLLLLPPPVGMPAAAWATVAVAFLMAVWWVSEAVPVAVTSLAPLLLFPPLGIADMAPTAAPYADPVIFLFLGGLTLGLALERWELHRRVALAIISRAGLKPRRLVLGFMLAAAFLSMWVSNTATAAMMLPICASTVVLLVGPVERFREASPEAVRFSLALLLGVAFAASIGGMATIVGTPPNALFVAFMRRTHGIEIGFVRWMALGLPVALVFLFGTWIIVTRIVHHLPAAELPGIDRSVATHNASLGPMRRPELLVAGVFLATAALWVTRPALAALVPGLTDTGIAVAAAVALFVIPSGRGGMLLDWATMSRLPWGVLILFGGGLSLAAAIAETGLADWLGARVAVAGALGPVALVAVAVAITLVVSELASNTATAATFLPVAAAVGAGLGLDAFALTVPVALAASGGLMLPVATPPNALFYASGYLRTVDFARTGALADLLGALLVIGATFTLAEFVFAG